MPQGTLSFSSPLPPPEPTILKLFQGGPQIGPQSTLRECVEAYVLPELDERAAATVEEYLSLLNRWEELTPNPAAGNIDRDAAKAFRSKLLETPYLRGRKKKKRSAATVNKILRTFKAAISPLWPADRHNPGGKNIIPFFKLLDPLDEQPKLPFVFSLKEMSALYLACTACGPKGGYRKTPLYLPFLWQCAIVLALNTGPRTWDLYRLRWEDVRWDDFKHGSVFFRARKTAKIQRVPLNAIARAHLERLRAMHVDAELVFPRFKKNKSFYAAWVRICTAAGVRAPFEAFRKTCSTKHDDVVKGVGAWITGHSLSDVNAKNYQNPTGRVLRAVYGLKNPLEFRRAAKAIKALAK